MSDNSDDASDTEEKGVLSPEELDITDDENVFKIEDNRYLISAGNQPVMPQENEDETKSSEEATTASDGTELDQKSVQEWLNDRVGTVDLKYGFTITAKFEDTTDRQEVFSNDVVMTFENLVGWYARHVGGETPIEEVLGILLMESKLPIKYPPGTLQTILDDFGITGDDSVSELIEASQKDDDFFVIR